MTYLKPFLLCFCLFLTLAFKVGENIELTSYLNARRTPDFISKKNIVRTLKAGTTGEIKQIKKFRSGNFGFKVLIDKGPYAGSSYWVYYNVKDPSIKVTTKGKTQPKEIPAEEISEDTVSSSSKADGELLDDHNGIEDPEETELKSAIDFIKDPTAPINNLASIDPCEQKNNEFDNGPLLISNDNDQESTSSHKVSYDEDKILTRHDDILSFKPHQPSGKACADATLDKVRSSCGLVVSRTSNSQSDSSIVRKGRLLDDIETYDIDLNKVEIIKKEDNDESSESAIKFELEKLNDRAPSDSKSYSCSSVGGDFAKSFQLCRTDKYVEAFQIQNLGPNNIVSSSDNFTGRTFSMHTEGHSISDAYLSVDVTQLKSNGQGTLSDKVMIFLPRTTPPSVKVSGKNLELTLPNKEKIIFDKDTGVITGGVLKESKVSPNSKISDPGVTYNGSGMIIELSRAAEKGHQSNIAKVSKGGKTCNINASELWANTDNSSKRTLLKSEFSTDEGLNQFINKKCNF